MYVLLTFENYVWTLIVMSVEIIRESFMNSLNLKQTLMY